MRWFKKEGMRRPLYTGKGWPIQFEDIGDDTGILATNEPYTIKEIEKWIESARGGVIEITKEQAEAEKKRTTEREQHLRRVVGSRQPQLRVEGRPQGVSPATSAKASPDPSVPDRVPIGAPVEVPAVPEPPKRGGRRPKAVKADENPVEATGQ